MRVIGTAGHVDHGKTALIRSMTGIDADRLPEEKARGMTTDLGFAWYEGGSGEAVGVVDVPGHERYLRNMVAGAWGLDLVVLVVAADDGWMPQTGLHASIVASLASPAVVIAVTKSDAVPPGRAASVAEEAAGRAAALFGTKPEAVSVSNRTGEGVSGLKAAIDRALAALPPVRREAAYLFVDRTFSPRGGGTVATGTLVGGSVSVGDELELLPRGENVRVRGIQSYHERIEMAEPTCRAAISLSGLKNGIQRGDVLTAPGAAMLVGTEFLCRLLPMPGRDEICPLDYRGRPAIRAGVEAEFAVGSARRDAVLWPLKPDGFVRIVTGEPLACPAGDSFVTLRRGGAELLGRGVVLRAGETTADDRRLLSAAIPKAVAAAARLAAPGWGRGGEAALRLALDAFHRGWAAAPRGLGRAEAAAAGLEYAAAPDGGRGAVFDPGRWTALQKTLTAAAGEPGGMSRAAGESLFAAAFPNSPAELASTLRSGGRPLSAAEAFAAVALRLEAEGSLSRSGSSWTLPGSARKLSAEESAALGRLKAAGKAGLEPGKTAPQTDARALKALCSFGEAMPLDAGIFFSRAAWDDCVAAILRGRKPGDRFSVPDAKDRSGLSRKYILPLLNRMESKGLVKRSGDERVVVTIID